MPKIIITYANFGQGHKQVASALESYLDAKAYDILDFSSNFFKRFFSYSYFIVTQRLPFIWKVFFYITKNTYIQKVIRGINILLANRFIKFILKEKPDVIIATHFFPLYFIEIVKKKLQNIKTITIITDIKVHPIWINKTSDLYFAPIEDTKKDLLRFSIPEDKVIAGYFPLREGFLKNLDGPYLRKKFSIDNGKDCLLFLLFSFDKLSTIEYAINSLKDNFNLFFIYNKNIKIKKYLDKFKNIRIFPFYEDIWELFYLSSVIITKPGGVTVFEGIFLKKPFVFMNFISGQEEENMRFLIENGVAKFAKDKYELVEAIYYFNNIKDRLTKNYPIQLKDIRSIWDIRLLR